MEHRDDGSCNRDPAHPPRPAWRARSDRELIVAMRADIPAAFEEFVARYQPLLLARSRRFELPQWEREDCVADVLESMMLRLVRPDVRAPREMAAYLTRALHNRLVDVSRARTTHDVTTESIDDLGTASIETAMAARNVVGGRAPSLSPALERLAHALIQPLTDEERQLIGWESNMIPHRTIAAWLGLSHAAATKRIWRLRTRVREIALRYAETLSAAERNEIERVINRDAATESSRRAKPEGLVVSGSRVVRHMTGDGGTAR